MASAAALLVNATLNGVTKVVKSCHSKMNASNTTAPMASMDHSQMDHSKMDHSKMDHSQMNHGNLHDGMVVSWGCEFIDFFTNKLNLISIMLR